MKKLYWLIRLRKESNMTQQEVADFVGVDRTHYSRIENGVHEPRPYTKFMIAEAVGFDVKEWDK